MQIRIRTQTVHRVLCQVMQCLFNCLFNLLECLVPGCDTWIVCLDEVPGSIVDGMVIVFPFQPSSSLIQVLRV